MNKSVFLSYCHANKSEASDVDESFMQDGIRLIRDQRDAPYGASLKEFMKGVRKTDYVLMLISDSFLKSKNCMFEVTEVLKDENHQKRILLIILDNDADIYSPTRSFEYLEFWRDKHAVMEERLRQHSLDEVIPLMQDLRIIRDIQTSIVEFISIIRDRNNLSFSEMKQSDFLEIKRRIGLQKDNTKVDRCGVHESQQKQMGEISYEVLEQRDVSHALAKRYSANILLSGDYSRTDIKGVIEKLTEELKNSSYHRSSAVADHFKDRKADVVWLFFAKQMIDVRNTNWICRSCWINSELDPKNSPSPLNGNDSAGDIQIDWNNRYQEMADFYASQMTTKDDFLKRIDELILGASAITIPYVEIFNEELKKGRGFPNTSNYAQRNDEAFNRILTTSSGLPIPTYECHKLDGVFQSYIATVHNLFMYFSEKGLETWKESNRINLMKPDVRRYKELEASVKAERCRL